MNNRLEHGVPQRVFCRERPKVSLQWLHERVASQVRAHARFGLDCHRLIFALHQDGRYGDAAFLIKATFARFERSLVENCDPELIELRRHECLRAINALLSTFRA